MDEVLALFIEETGEQLAAMESLLLDMEQGQHDAEALNAIFRAAHTIKGSAGVVEQQAIERFTHVVENLLDKLRNGEIPVSSPLISALLACCDHLAALVGKITGTTTQDDATLTAAGQEIHARLHVFLADTAPSAATGTLTPPAGTAAAAQVHEGETEADGDATAITDCWHISVRFGEDVLRHGMDPAAILRYLLTLGEIVHIDTLADALPAAAQMNPESCYLGFEISFRSSADKAAIERVFDFVRDECVLHILPPYSRISDYLRLIEALPEESLRLGEILIRSGALTEEELQQGLARQQQERAAATDSGNGITDHTEANAAPGVRLGEILIENQAVQPEIVAAAVNRQKQISDKKADEARLIRVHAGKLDHLIDLVGELVIAGASASLLAQQSRQGTLIEATSVLTRLVEDIRDSALQLRMVQIGETFNRFHRVVRDTARELDKEIDLAISGGETELDKSVVEKIGDPLMHLVRNALDHGIETRDVRLARGKPPAGQVTLHASHDAGNIVIQIRDDGGGLVRDKIRAKAISRGLIAEGQTLSDSEICNLIFEAGFSTAETVTNLSGRGVGMDVVRRNIQALRGTVEVESVEGQGSCFTIRLPLTLAIIDGFLVGVERASYVIPLEMVSECLELASLENDRHYLNLRGEVLPFVRLRELFEVSGSRPRRENVVVVRAGSRKFGIVVDVLQGELQAVIKPLGAIFRQLRGIAGSTILGSGEVALILDIPTLSQLTIQNEENTLSHSRARA